MITLVNVPITPTHVRRIAFWIFLFVFWYAPFVRAQVPDHQPTVRAVFARGYSLGSKSENCRFTRDVAAALHQIDSSFGLLKKRPSQNQCDDSQTAVDAVLYLPTGQAVDIIQASDSPQASPTWIVDVPRYGSSEWLAPAIPTPGTNPPTPEPDPSDDALALAALVEQRLVGMEQRLAQQQHASETRLSEQSERIYADLVARLNLLAERPPATVDQRADWIARILSILTALMSASGAAK